MKKFMMSPVAVLTIATLTACGGGGTAPGSAPEDEQRSAAEVPSIEPTEIYNSDGLVVTASGIAVDNYGDYTVYLDIQNDSDTDVDWTVSDWTINGINISCATFNSVPASKSGTAEFPIYGDDLYRYGIEQINTIQIHSQIVDPESYDVNGYTDSETIVTSLGADYDLSLPIEEYEKVYSDKNFDVYYVNIENMEDGSDYAAQANLLFYNHSEEQLNVYPEDVSFDDKMDYENYYSFSTYPESYTLVHLVSTNSLEAVSEAEFSALISDLNTGTVEYTTDPITVSLK